MNCSSITQSLLTQENDHLKKRLQEMRKELNSLQFQYSSLEEDFLHAVKEKVSNRNLKGKKIVYIGGNTHSIDAYHAITQSYQAELILPKNNSIEAACEAIELADEVICPIDCQNQDLCHATQSSCTKFNKPFRRIENSSPQILQQELAQIAVQIQ